MTASGIMPGRTGGQTGLLGNTLWWLLALAACLSVLIINGRPLFYFDSSAYVIQGTTALTQLGLFDPAAEAGSSVGAAVQRSAGTVDGSRSAPFAVLMALFAHYATLNLFVLMNALLTLLAIALPLRVARRLHGPMPPLALMVAVPVLVAALGALPFYVAFLMPDILTPVLLISLATLTVFARQMTMGELAVALVLGMGAVISHLSHLAVAGLMVPLAFVVAPLMGRARWWLPPLLVSLVFGFGYGETRLLRLAAKEVANAEVILIPFLTGRLIQDGTGYDYLARHCPDPAIATCALYDALQKSDDPERLTASHVIFETSPRLGSFRLLSDEDQRKVAEEQFGFFGDVLRDAPLAMITALLNNTLLQARMFSVDMTVPVAVVAESARTSGLAQSLGLVPGRLPAEGAWLEWATAGQTLLYAGALAAVLVLLILPGRVPGPVKAFAIVLLCGVLANALVCGGISQPATRYGARAIWLLPLVAAILALFARRRVA